MFVVALLTAWCEAAKMCCASHIPPPALAPVAVVPLERSGACSPGCNCVTLGTLCGDAIKVAQTSDAIVMAVVEKAIQSKDEHIAKLERSVKSLGESLGRAVDYELKAMAYAEAVEKRVQKLYEQVKELEKKNAALLEENETLRKFTQPR